MLTALNFATCLGGFLFGLYSGMFAMFWQYHASKETAAGHDGMKWQNIILYVVCVLYVLSVIDIALDISITVDLSLNDGVMSYRLDACRVVVFAFCDFITQSILIHRCWIMWGCNIRIVIIPIILAFAFLVTWMAGIGSQSIAPSNRLHHAAWISKLVLAAVTASMTVNALVTGLIVFRISKVFLKVKSITTSDKMSLSTAGERKLRLFIFIIIESGLVLFAIQLTRVLMVALHVAPRIYYVIVPVHEMLNGIVPTLTLLRVSMGLSFHDEPSFVEAVSASFEFAVENPDQNPIGMGSIGSVDRV